MIYLAAPLFNQRERDYNARLRALIGYPMYLPQEDGELIVELIARGASLDAAIRRIHENDIVALKRCEMLVGVLDGPHVDSGVAFELGFFHALGKPIIGLHTDNRSELPFGQNPMITGSSLIVRTEEELISAVNAHFERKKS